MQTPFASSLNKCTDDKPNKQKATKGNNELDVSTYLPSLPELFDDDDDAGAGAGDTVDTSEIL